MVLEVDGQHHAEGEQTIRDYARDRVLLRSGMPTEIYRADCIDRADAVVTEFLAILQGVSHY